MPAHSIVALFSLHAPERQPGQNGEGTRAGSLFGILPTFGAGSVLAILASSWLGWNRAATVLGTFIANPLLNPLFLSLSVIAGNLVVPPEFRIVLETVRQGDWWPRLLSLLPTYFVGNLLVSALFAALAYAAGVIAVTEYRKRRDKHSEKAG